MNNTSKLLEIIKIDQNVVFGKSDCPFAQASLVLIQALKDSQIINDFRMLYLDSDFTNSELKEVMGTFGWQPTGYQEFPTKPQIFINGKYVGDNMQFYLSDYNVGQNKPNLKNPRYF